MRKELTIITVFFMVAIAIVPIATLSRLSGALKLGTVVLIINIAAIAIVEICGAFALKEIAKLPDPVKSDENSRENNSDNGEETVNEKSEKDKE